MMRLLVQIFDILLFPVAAVTIDVDTGRTWYGAVESCQYVDVLAVVEMGILDVSIDKVENKSDGLLDPEESYVLRVSFRLTDPPTRTPKKPPLLPTLL